MTRFCALVLAVMSVSVVHAAPPNASVQSPSGVLTVSVTLDSEGRPSYDVQRNGKAVIGASRLGFLLADVPKLALKGESRRRAAQEVPQPAEAA